MNDSKPNFLDKPDISIDQYFYDDIVESLDSSFDWQVSDPDEFDFSHIFFSSCDIECVLADSISLVDFFFYSEVDLIDHKSLYLGTIESSLVDSTLTMPFVEDSKVTCVSAKVTASYILF